MDIVKTRNRVSLHAVFAGVSFSLVCLFVLVALGAAIGLTAFRADEEIAQGVGIGFLAWFLLSLCLSSFLGAWVASVVGRARLRRDGIMTGLVTWSVATLIGLFLVSTQVKSALGGMYGFVRHTATSAVLQPQAREDAIEAVENVGAKLEADPAAAANAEDTARGAALGFWGILALHVLPFAFALLGGWAGAGAERRVERRTGLRTRVRDRDVAPRGPTLPQPT